MFFSISLLLVLFSSHTALRGHRHGEGVAFVLYRSEEGGAGRRPGLRQSWDSAVFAWRRLLGESGSFFFDISNSDFFRPGDIV